MEVRIIVRVRITVMIRIRMRVGLARTCLTSDGLKINRRSNNAMMRWVTYPLHMSLTRPCTVTGSMRDHRVEYICNVACALYLIQIKNKIKIMEQK